MSRKCARGKKEKCSRQLKKKNQGNYANVIKKSMTLKAEAFKNDRNWNDKMKKTYTKTTKGRIPYTCRA